MFIAIVENSQVARSGHISMIFPNSVFGAAGPDATWLADNNAYVVQMSMNHDRSTQRLVTCDPYYSDGVVYGVRVHDFDESDAALAFNQKWDSVRAQRSMLLNRMQWRLDRWARETRMGLTTTDNINELDAYFQALADITKQADPDTVVWPEIPQEAAR